MGLFNRGGAAVSPKDAGVGGIQASAERARQKDGEVRRGTLEWQRKSLQMYDQLGECWYPAQFYGRMLSQVRLYVGQHADNGEVEEVDDDNVQKVLARIQDPGGGSAQWKDMYGRLMFLIGDAFLAATAGEEDEEERWEVLSPLELKPTDKGPDGRQRYQRVTMPGSTPTEFMEAPDDALDLIEGEMRAWRLWRRHPAYSKWADAPVRAVLDLYEELILTGGSVRATALSRAGTAGILLVSDSVTLPNPDATAAGQNPRESSFLRRLGQHIMAPISNPNDASAVVPMLMKIANGERPVRDFVDLLELRDPQRQFPEEEVRRGLIRRIALGLDMPPERMLEISEANHWSGWLIDEQSWNMHGKPVTIQLCGDLTYSYLRPALRAEEVQRAEDYIVWYDDGEVVSHPDQGKDANEVYDRVGMKREGLFNYHNIDESYLLDDEEQAAYDTKKTPVVVPSSAGPGNVEPGAPGDGEPPPADEPTPASTNGNQLVRLQAVGDAHVERARERVGAKLRAMRQSCPECFAGTEELPNSLVAAELGMATLTRLGIPHVGPLLDGTTDAFVISAESLDLGLTPAQALAVGREVELQAALTLLQRKPGTLNHKRLAKCMEAQ